MDEHMLRDCAILVVEDEYLLADDLCAELTERGAAVVGPAATIEQGIACLRDAKSVDCAILDINLRGEPAFALADELKARQVPFVFATGYDASVIPERFADVPRCEKPVRVARIVEAIGLAVHA